MYSDLWFVFGVACLVAGGLGTAYWLWLTGAPEEPASVGTDEDLPADPCTGSAGLFCFACREDRRRKTSV